EAYVRFRRRAGNAKISLHAAGYMAPNHRSYLEQAHDVLRQAGLGDEFTYHGSLDRKGKVDFLRSLDVLSVPATYDEPKGMFLLESMAAGVPVVQPKRGAFTEVVEKTGGGLLVAPDSVDAVADGLHRVWSDRALSATLAGDAFDGVRAHYTIEQSATRQVAVYESAIRRASAGLPC
ncbi:MAG TPA: glycosyltransferase family 4 protein, partial [Vicinamibacterales bacterium]|nr:glycosyltransferase family 4 protein [Vicinamibacterales bacterium]